MQSFLEPLLKVVLSSGTRVAFGGDPGLGVSHVLAQSVKAEKDRSVDLVATPGYQAEAIRELGERHRVLRIVASPRMAALHSEKFQGGEDSTLLYSPGVEMGDLSRMFLQITLPRYSATLVRFHKPNHAVLLRSLGFRTFYAGLSRPLGFDGNGELTVREIF